MLIISKVFHLKILLYLFGLQRFINSQYQGCTTPSIPTVEYLDGVCVSRPECKVIYDIVKSNPEKISPSVLTYFIKADCGTYNGVRFVCCKMHYLSDEMREKLSREKPEPTSLISSRELRVPLTPALKTQKNIHSLKHPNIKLLPEECQSFNLDINDRISNGDDALIDEFKFIAMLQYESSNGNDEEPLPYCGASLISSRYVLTAAHCVNINNFILKSVRLGEYNTNTNPDCSWDNEYCTNPIQEIPVEETAIHENFNLKVFANDIALIRLAKPANMKVNNVAPICLPIYPELQEQVITDGIVIGWGSTEKYVRSSILQKAIFPITERSKCQNFYRRYNIPVFESHICAGGLNAKDTCRGDSGGPLFVAQRIGSNIIPHYIQHGVVSGGTSDCGNISFPGIYSNVSYFLNWILDKMRL